MQKTIFITGGGGFIGTSIIQRLFDRFNFIIYDNLIRNAIQFTDLIDKGNIRLIKGDILDKDLLAESIGNASVIVHLSAMAGVSNYSASPVQTMMVNFQGTFNLLQAIKDRALKLFLYLSSSELYGRNAVWARETDPPSLGDLSSLRWTYAISKLAAEQLLFAYFRQHSLPLIILRPFNIYGPLQIGESAVRNFILACLKNEPIQITGKGNQIRSWCYISDFLEAVIACLEGKGTYGNIYNIGNPETACTILELAQMIQKLIGSNSDIRFIPHPSEEIVIRIPNIEKARLDLGFNPTITLEQGLDRTIAWYKQNLHFF